MSNPGQKEPIGKLTPERIAAAVAVGDGGLARADLRRFVGTEKPAQMQERNARNQADEAEGAATAATIEAEEAQAEKARLAAIAEQDRLTQEFLEREGLLNQGAAVQAPEMGEDDPASIALARRLQSELDMEEAGQGPAGDAELARELQKLEEQRASGAIKVVGGAAKLSPPQLDRGRGGGDDSNC